jgi:Fatty acid hydroxylase superfamily
MNLAFVAFVSFLVAEAIGWFLHRLAHCPWAGPYHRYHMRHHLEFYPPERFSSDRYLGDFKTSLVVWMAPFFVVLGAIAYALMALPAWLAAVAGAGAAAWLNDSLHTAFHLRETLWSGLGDWFARRKLRHFLHHVDMLANMGIWEHAIDRRLGTFRGV